MYNFVFFLLTLLVRCNAQNFQRLGNLNVPFHNGEPPEHVPYPEQQYCDEVSARKLCGAGPSAGEWAVVKVTPLPKPLPPHFDMNINFCSPFSYAPEVCREMLVGIIEYEHDQSLTLQTFAYNNQPTGVCALGKIIVLTSRYLDFLFVEEFFDDEHHTINNPIPEVVLYSQGEMFAKVAKSDDDKWMIFQNCNTQFAWVVVQGDMKIEDLPKYEKEYHIALDTLGIDIDNMVNVPVEDADGLSFRQCLYNLNDIVSATVL